MSGNHVCRSDPAVELHALRGEVSSLLLLAYETAQKLDVVLERIESAPEPRGRVLRAIGLRYLATASSAQLRADLVEARGAQSACVLATKLDSDLIALGKQRPVVRGNGNGGAAHGAAD
jgi:hypothetical protein